MKTFELAKQNYGKPTNTKIEINPEKASRTTPQAWENNWNWYYNWQGAMDESKYRGERLPTTEELLESINSIPWNCIEKAKAMDIPFAGYRLAGGGEFDDEGVIAYLWSSSPDGGGDAQYVCLRRGLGAANGGLDDRGHGFPARSFLDKSDHSSLWLFHETINILENMRVEKQIELERITEAIKLLRKF